MGKKKRQKELTQHELECVLRPLSDEQMESLTKKELLILLRGEQTLRHFFEEAHQEAVALNKELENKVLSIEGTLTKLKCRIFNPKSEKSSSANKLLGRPASNKEKRRPLAKERDLQKRYPDAEVIEKELRLETLPTCSCCKSQMSEMGVFEQSQFITVIPKKYLITNILRMKYHCTHCYSSIQTSPTLPRVVPKSSYGDAVLIDAALSKFCDLIPVERYAAMAARGGFVGLPPSSLHEGIARLAEFLRPLYELIRIETLDSWILQGDETTHEMFEQVDDKEKQWYVWGFFGISSCFYEYHDTRAGRVAGDVLSESGCQYFLSDAFSGYGAGIRDVNSLRELAGLTPIREVLCHAHARRGFDEIKDNEDAATLIADYREVYRIEKEVKELLPLDFNSAKNKREEISPILQKMKEKADADLNRYSTHHDYYGACRYFLNNYEGLCCALEDPRIPLDNNRSERGLRSTVVGRKTWYGTHSERGAEMAAIHFTIIESCKMTKVNPREYYSEMIESMHYKRPLLTPSHFKAKANK